MNNSKQTILSIVGIAILVIAVVGVSFAFFTYSRTGTTNNVITTGSIEFEYEEDTQSALSLTNQFPQSDAEGAAANEAFEFDVVGTIPASANSINYKVYVVPGEAETGKTRFADDQISIKVTTAAHTGSATTGVVETGYDTAHALSSAISTGSGIQVAHGTITNLGTEEQHDYTLTMWVNDTVTISDTDASKTYRAKEYDATDWPEMPGQNPEGKTSADADWDETKLPYGGTDGRTVYSDLYYSIKVNVEATDAVSS